VANQVCPRNPRPPQQTPYDPFGKPKVYLTL
jgi:hypothetical protein